MPDHGPIPYTRFAAVVAERRDLAAQVDALETRIADLEDQADTAEATITALTSDRDSLTAALTEARDQVKRLTTDRWITDAASAAGFLDPTEARLFVKADPSSPEDASRAVARLAEAKPYLVTADTRPRPHAGLFGTPAPRSHPAPEDDARAVVTAIRHARD